MLNSVSSAALYGKGIFTTLAVLDGVPFLWEKHWRRLTANAASLEIDISEHSEPEIFERLTLEIKNKGLRKGRARITFYDESPSEIWAAAEKKTRLSIITGEPREIPKNFKLTISPHGVNTTSPLTGVKSCNYVENLLAYKDAKARGFDEAIRLNERGEIASACMANIFWLMGDGLFTPSLKTGCLAGTTREYVLENLECAEVEAPIEILQNADAIFLTSAGIGAVGAAEFDGRIMAARDHPIVSLLLK